MGEMSGTMQYEDGYWWSKDGLRLHYRDYAGPKERPPILCLPGLTRNVRDFESVAERLSPHWRVICVDLRGRGESAYAKDSMTYVPISYAQDIEHLLAHLKIKRFITFGTSLGGLVSMLLAVMGPKRIVGALLNDVGPVVEECGLARIRTTVGKLQNWPTWVHAARSLAEAQGETYPDYDLADWVAMAKQLYRLGAQGRIVPDYDSKIAEPMRLPNEAFDLWPAFDALCANPVLLLRGALSDVLSPSTATMMEQRQDKLKLITVPRVGHAPSMNEPVAVKAINALLRSVTV